jgi:RNA polymerase sigma-70 factor (ECF subfamily)
MSIARIVSVTADLLASELEEIFREHGRLVYRTAYSVTASAPDAEDIVQNLFLHLLRKGCPPGLRENPKGYLYRSAINLSLNTLKSRKHHISTADDCPDVSAECGSGDHARDTQKQLVNAMSQLHPGAVEMLVLRYEHGYSDAEIAKLLGKSRGVVAVGLYRARAKLRKLLSGRGK